METLHLAVLLLLLGGLRDLLLGALDADADGTGISLAVAVLGVSGPGNDGLVDLREDNGLGRVVDRHDGAGGLGGGAGGVGSRVASLRLLVRLAREHNKLGLVSLEAVNVLVERLSREVGAAAVNRDAKAEGLLLVDASNLKEHHQLIIVATNHNTPA